MHDNSQCSVCAQHKGGWGSTGGLVPVVTDLTHLPSAHAAAANSAYDAPRFSLGSRTGAQTSQAVGVGKDAAGSAAVQNGTATAAVLPGRSSLHLEVDALSRPVQAMVQQQQQNQNAQLWAVSEQTQPQQQQQAGAAADSLIKLSDSRTCLLSANPHSHDE